MSVTMPVNMATPAADVCNVTRAAMEISAALAEGELKPRHEPVGLQEVDDQAVETSRVLDAAGVPGARQHPMHGAGHEARGSFPRRQRIVEFAVDHQRRH